MQRIILFFSTFLYLALTSCMSEEDSVIGDATTYDMSFSGGVSGYDEGTASRASSVTISNGAKMYALFKSGGSIVTYGTATYNGGKWTLTTNAQLTNGSGDVVLHYFVNPQSTSSTSVTCNAETAVYSSTGSWSFSSNTLRVSGTLKPVLTRIRFKGASSTSFTVSKLTSPSSFSISTSTLSTTESSQSMSMSSSGYSGYVYATPSSLQNMVVTVSGTGYTKNSMPAVDAVKSIVVDLPTATDHAGWSIKNGPDSEEPEYEPSDTHEAVDLGLSVKWATCNVGAKNPEEYGDYFAWGATAPQEWYLWLLTPYQTQNATDESSTKFTKYLGSTSSYYKDASATDADALKTKLDLEDDAAHVNWGGDWRMPTIEEQDGLIYGCYWQWVTSYNGKSVNGYIVYKVKDAADKGKKTNNSNSYSPVGSYSVSDPHLFLPAAGYRNGIDFECVGSDGFYWSSSLYPDYPFFACCLYFNSVNVNWYFYDRYRGLTVRPVCPHP